MQLHKRYFFSIALLACTASTISCNDDIMIEIEDSSEATRSESNNQLCNFCWWRGNNNTEDEQLLINQDEPSSSEMTQEARNVRCGLLRSLFCRCKRNTEELDLESSLSDDNSNLNLPIDEAENNEQNQRCCSLNRSLLKKLPGNAAEILLKTGAAVAFASAGPHSELTFFFQHHASEAIGRHIKFPNAKYPLLKYTLASIATFGAGLGFQYLDETINLALWHNDIDLIYHSGAYVLGCLTIIKLINNYFDQVNRGGHHED